MIGITDATALLIMRGITRRKFLITATGAAAAGIAASPFIDAQYYKLSRLTIPVPELPPAFDGLRIALLADLHYGPFFTLAHIREVVAATNALGADIIFLGGDYVYRFAKYIVPVMRELGALSAPMGVFAVLGNHDIDAGRRLSSEQLKRNGIREITNTGTYLTRGGERLWLAGVDSCIQGHPNIPASLAGIGPEEPALMLTHSPDLIEELRDKRVKLAFAGHTHAGQVYLPLIGSPIVPSNYGQKYRYGLVDGPTTRVFVTSGVGAIFPPLRIDCPAEIALLTLARGAPQPS